MTLNLSALDSKRIDCWLTTIVCITFLINLMVNITNLPIPTQTIGSTVWVSLMTTILSKELTVDSSTSTLPSKSVILFKKCVSSSQEDLLSISWSSLKKQTSMLWAPGVTGFTLLILIWLLMNSLRMKLYIYKENMCRISLNLMRTSSWCLHTVSAAIILLIWIRRKRHSYAKASVLMQWASRSSPNLTTTTSHMFLLRKMTMWLSFM